MPLFESGPTTPYNALTSGAIPNEIFLIAINYYFERAPVTATFPKQYYGSEQVTLFNDDYRPTQFTTSGAFASGSDTTLTMPDTSFLDLGDVIQVESEWVQVTAVLTATTATVVRGIAGTTAAAHASGIVSYLVTNSRTGAEINQTGMSRIPVGTIQNSQTIQHAYSVGGALQAKTAFMGGQTTPLERDKMMAIRNCLDDHEKALYYGKGQAENAVTARPIMKGFDSLIATNKVVNPSDAAGYKLGSLLRDVITPATTRGGNPNLLLVSSDWQGAFVTWGGQLQRLDAGTSDFGVKINKLYAPFLDGIEVQYCPFLRTGTAVALTREEVKVGYNRLLNDYPRGRRGDAVEGDMIMEGTLLLSNEGHHAMVSGITGYASG